MDKIKAETLDTKGFLVGKLGEVIPQVVTEKRAENGKIKKAIDFEKLKALLEEQDEIVEPGEEHYEFTWVGKKEAMIEANRPINKTLRPCKEESKDWDKTENLYIEGDNLEVLKLLQESYLNSVKMIYIDPPYNTGNDFIYNDDYKMTNKEYQEESGEIDEEGNRLFKNNETNGRFHSDWCSMMYSRLMLVRNLLSDDGVIFISIDDNEVMNLTKMCDEIFGEKNRIALICHKARASISNDKVISPNHNTILFYSKDFDKVFDNRKSIGLDPVIENFKYDDNDGKGEYKLVPVDGPGGAKKGNPYYEFLGIEGYFRFAKETMKEKYNNGFVVKKGNSLYQKYYKKMQWRVEGQQLHGGKMDFSHHQLHQN